jgi:glycosyltransferase involved in cell wall biosynthesis
MKIGIDVRHLSGGFGTGGARVLENCLRAFSEHDSETRFVPYNRFEGKFWVSTKVGQTLAPVLADAVNKNIALPLWSRSKKLDALFYVLPPISFTQRRVPQICYILDVPLETEERFLAAMIYNDIYIKQSCLKADLLLTISQDAADQIMRRYQVPPEKIKVAYLCADLDYIKRVPVCSPLPGRDGFFLGIISRIYWRKNPGAYLETFRLLPKELRARYPLVLLGAVKSLDDLRQYASAETIEEVRDDVICLGRVSDDALIGYIKGAKALLFPSNYEGFGLPILEAVACGTPAIASDIPVFKELFSDVASLYAPDDYQGMASMLEQVIKGNAPRLLEEKAQEWLRRFSFETYARRVKQLIEAVWMTSFTPAQ